MIKCLLSSPGLISGPLYPKPKLILTELHSLTLSTPCLVFLLGLNLTPEANEAGAAFTPKLNAFANNLTRWELTVEDVQVVPNMELFYSD